MSGVAISVPEELIERAAERALELLTQAHGRDPLARADPGGWRASPYLTVPEAAEYLRCKRQRIYDLLSAQRLTRYKDGRRVLVSRAEIDAYLAGSDSRQVAPALPRTARSRVLKGLAA